MSKTRALLIIVGAVLAVFMVGAALIPLLSRSATTATTSNGPVTRLVVHSERGAVTIGPGAVDRVSQSASAHWVLTRPSAVLHRDRDTVTVDVTCPAWAFVSCSADVDLRVPPTVEVQATVVRGRLAVRGITGPVTVLDEDGDVRLDGAPSRLDARTVTGSLTVALTAAPEKVRLRSETGRVALLLPRGRYALTAASGRGTVRVGDITRDAAAPHVVDVSSGAGDVLVGAGP